MPSHVVDRTNQPLANGLGFLFRSHSFTVQTNNTHSFTWRRAEDTCEIWCRTEGISRKVFTPHAERKNSLPGIIHLEPVPNCGLSDRPDWFRQCN